MYAFFEYVPLLVLVVLVATLLFDVSVVFVMVEEGIAAVARISRKTSGNGTREGVFVSS